MRNPASWLLLAISSAAAYACECEVPASSVEAYRRAEAIFLADVVDVVAKRFPFENRGFVAGQAVTVHIREAFKGFAEGADLTFDNAFSSCNGVFQRGEQVLFRMWRDQQSGKWYHAACGTRRLKDARADLVFLRAFRGVPGKHRVAGAVEWYETSAALGYRRVGPIANIPVRIVSGDFQKSLSTNAAGVFEVYDLPPGRYRVEVEPPAGLKIHHAKSDLWIEVRSDASVEAGVVFADDRTVFGKVLDAEGRPVEGVRVSLWLADFDAQPYSLLDTVTKADGSYRIENVPAGAYWVVANPWGRITARSPIPKTYYPGVASRSDAHVIQLQAGTRHRELDFHIPKAAARVTLRGRVQFADGAPVPWTEVELLAAGMSGQDSADTNELGEFRLFALRGSTGYLQVQFLAGLDDQQTAAGSCSTEWRRPELTSNPLRVTASQDRESLVLTIPVAACGPWIAEQRRMQEIKKKTRTR